MNAVEFIEQFIDTEGLFRKSGSVSRQKELKVNKCKCLKVKGLLKGGFRHFSLISEFTQDYFVGYLLIFTYLD